MIERSCVRWHTALFLLIASAFAFASCAPIRPLSLDKFGRNVVILEDETMLLEGKDPIALDRLRQELVGRMISDKTRITLHFHRELTQGYFDEVLNKFVGEGFENLRFEVYRD